MWGAPAVWFWLWAGLTQGLPQSPCLQPLRGVDGARCELVRLPQSFPAAQAWCRQRRGRLLHAWDQHAAEVLQGQLDRGRKSWIGPGAEVPPEEAQASERDHGRATTSCPAIVRRGRQFWARREPCSEELFFICQFGPARTLRDASQRSACQRMVCGSRQRTAATPGATSVSMTGLPSTQPTATTHPQPSIHVPASTPRPSTPAQPGSQPGTAPQSQGGSQHPPSLPPAPSTPEPAADSGPPLPSSKAAVEHQTPATPPPLAPSPPPLLPGATEQALEKLHQAVLAPERPLSLEGAARELEGLTRLHALLSGAAQASASQTLLLLSTRLPTDPPASNASATAALALFQALGNLLQARDANPARTVGSQPGDAPLEETLAALPRIQAGLLLGHLPAESPVAVASPTLSTTLHSCSTASLPGCSLRLAEPAPLEVTFPTASLLVPPLSLHGQGQVRVQVASFALNPFRHLEQRPMSRVASVTLSTQEGPLDLQGLAEDVEIVFGGQGRPEPSPTGLTNSTGHFGVALNITSTADALLVSLSPRVPLQVALCLVPRPQPPSGHCLCNTTLPRSRWQEEGAYVWLVPPEALQQHGPGPYLISAQVTPVSQDRRGLSISVVSTGCYYWAGQHQAWQSNGCRVGPRSTLRSTQCLCNHLSFFGCLSLVLPCTIDLQRVDQLLSRVGQNPAGVALLGSLLLGFGAALLWAHRKQRADLGKVKVTLLADNEAGARCPYLVQIFTGYRRGAGTSAKVTLTLYGAEGQSEPHLLQHPQGPGFERGDLDAFLLATRRPLGDLHAIRLWHDNAGPDPSWFVRQLVVSDLHARKKWHFLCDCWLAADMDDGQLDKVFVAASERELLSFGHLFWAGLVDRLTQEHLWLSVATCSPWSPFTRLQRLSCCLALQLCSMLINIMFWKRPLATGTSQEPEGPFVVTWQELVVSVEAAVLLLPVHLLIVHAFRLIQPSVPLEPPPAAAKGLPTSGPSKPAPAVAHIQQELMEALGFLCKNRLCQGGDAGSLLGASATVPELVAGLSSLIHSHLQCLENSEAPPQERSCSFHRYLSHKLEHLVAQLWGFHDQRPAAEQLLRLRQHLEQQDPWPCTEEPRRWSLVCWAVVGTTSLTSAFWTVLYSLELSREQATHWALTVLLSLLQSFLLMQPLKALVLSCCFSLLRKRPPRLDKGQEQQLRCALGLAERLWPTAAPSSREWTSLVYRPPPLKPPLSRAQQKVQAGQEKVLSSLLREIVVQLVFLAVLMVLSYAERSPSEFYLNDILQKSLAGQVGHIRTPEQLYGWARHTLLPLLYENSAGLALNGNFVLVGSARLRQIRAQGAPPPHGSAGIPPWTSSLEQMARSSPTLGAPGQAQEPAWVYQSEASLQEYPIWGTFAVYPGGGYLASLGTNASYASSVLQSLEEKHWLDRGTRAVLLEFVLYNANVNLFCVATLLWETNGLGPFLGSAELQILRLYLSRQVLVPLACAHVSFLLLILYCTWVQGQLLKRQKWQYFHGKGNLLDAVMLLLCVAAVGLYAKRCLLAESLLRRHRQDRSSFISFYETVKVDAALTYLIAFLVALATVKLWHLLQLNPRLYLISQTLRKAWEEVLGFLLTLLVLLVGYTIACNLLFGWSIDSYKTFFDSAVSIVGLLVGIFNYEVVLALDPVLGSLLICTSVISMAFVIMNLLVSVLLTTLAREMKASEVSKKESLMQLLQLKLTLWLGLKRQAPQPADAQD